MRRLSERSLWYLTSLTLLALLIVGVATTDSMSRYADSMNAVSHTRRVETAIESIRADLYSAQHGCLAYVFAGQPEALQQFEFAASALLPTDLRPPPGLRFQRKDTEQYHVCLAAPGIARTDRRRFAASPSTRSSAARPRPGSSRRSARSAAWRTRSTRSPRSTATPARSGSTSARGRTTSPTHSRSPRSRSRT